MEVRKLAVEETAFLHLRSADDALLYEKKKVEVDGEPVEVDDESKPVGIWLFGPGTKVYARANASKENRLLARVRKRGKAEMTAEENFAENANFLVACTKSFQHIQLDGLEGEALYRGVYTEPTLGFIADQVMKFLGEWGNFSKASTTT